MLDDMRRYVREGLGMLGGSGSDDVAENVRARVQAVAEQMSTLAAGFLGWSAEARASLLREVKDLVNRQVKEMGLATRKEVEGLRARVEKLEGRPRAAGGRGAASTPRAKASAARTRPAKSSARGSTSAASSGRKGTGRSGEGRSAAGGRSGRGGRSSTT